MNDCHTPWSHRCGIAQLRRNVTNISGVSRSLIELGWVQDKMAIGLKPRSSPLNPASPVIVHEFVSRSQFSIIILLNSRYKNH